MVIRNTNKQLFYLVQELTSQIGITYFPLHSRPIIDRKMYSKAGLSVVYHSAFERVHNLKEIKKKVGKTIVYQTLRGFFLTEKKIPMGKNMVLVGGQC